MTGNACPDCETAALRAFWGAYRAGCVGCRARMAAHSPAYAKSEHSGHILPEYRSMLLAVGEKNVELAHAAARAWRRRLDALELEWHEANA